MIIASGIDAGAIKPAKELEPLMKKIVFIPGPFGCDERFLAYLNILFPECEIVVQNSPEKGNSILTPDKTLLSRDR